MEWSKFTISIGPREKWALIWTGVAVAAVPVVYIIRYRKAIRTRLDEIEKRLALGVIYRDTTRYPLPSNKIVRAMELHPRLKEHCNERGLKVMSLGEYLSSLRLNQIMGDDDDDIPTLVEKEMEAIIGAMILRRFGPQFGAALLPMLGIEKVDSLLGRVAAGVASYFASHILADYNEAYDPTEESATFPFSVLEMSAFFNLHRKARSARADIDSSLDWMSRGEIGYDPPYVAIETNQGDYITAATTEEERDLVPNPFIVENHFEAAIVGLEDIIKKKSSADAKGASGTYDPNDRSYPEPTPINDRVLPGLCLGYAGIECTHTKREVLRNRLFAVLLTRLSFNYHLLETDGDTAELFEVQYKGEKIVLPDEFVNALMKSGHTIEISPATTLTTFGVGASVKEDDGTWTNVPITFFFRTGFETPEGRPVYFSAAHGGMDLDINGPLVGEGNRCNIQFYAAIEGLCGWHSNHNFDVPWYEKTRIAKVYNKEQTLEAVRLIGLLANVVNTIATEKLLPMGGYGVMGVCNDSAALVDFAVRKETDVFPLISTGSFLFHLGNRLLQMESSLGTVKLVKSTSTMRALQKLVAATCNIPSDIHCSPQNLEDATRRFSTCNPNPPFQLTEDSANELKELSRKYSSRVSSGRFT